MVVNAGIAGAAPASAFDFEDLDATIQISANPKLRRRTHYCENIARIMTQHDGRCYWLRAAAQRGADLR